MCLREIDALSTLCWPLAPRPINQNVVEIINYLYLSALESFRYERRVPIEFWEKVHFAKADNIGSVLFAGSTCVFKHA